MTLTTEQMTVGILKERYFSVEDALAVVAWAIEEEIEITIESHTQDDLEGKKVKRVEVRVPRGRW